MPAKRHVMSKPGECSGRSGVRVRLRRTRLPTYKGLSAPKIDIQDRSLVSSVATSNGKGLVNSEKLSN